MFRVRNLMIRIGRGRDTYHFSVFGVVSAGRTGRGIFHVLVLILRVWIWNDIVFRLIVGKISGVGLFDPTKHLFSHIDIVFTWKVLDNAGGEKRNSVFRARINVVALIEVFEDQGYPSGK